MTVKIALLQIESVQGDAEGNLRRAQEALNQSATEGAQYACLPACFRLGRLSPNTADQAEPIPGPTTEMFGRLAHEKLIYLAAGLTRSKKDGDQTKIFCSAFFINTYGKVTLDQDQICIQEHCRGTYTGGSLEESLLVDTGYGRAMLAIDEDALAGELLSRFAEKNPEIVFSPAAWMVNPSAKEQGKGPEEVGGEIEKRLAALCRQYKVYLFAANSWGCEVADGPWAGAATFGRSLAIGPDGAVLARGSASGPDIVLAEVDLD